jgi:hypothetical protein
MVKNFDDPRLKNRRKYYPSMFLTQPKVIDDDIAIEQFDSFLRHKNSFQHEYLEPFTNNRVKYQRWLVDEYDRQFLDERLLLLTGNSQSLQ